MKLVIKREDFDLIGNAVVKASSDFINTAAIVAKVFSPEKAEVMKKAAKSTDLEKIWADTKTESTVGCSVVRLDENTVEVEFNSAGIAKGIGIVGGFYKNLISPAMVFGTALLQTKLIATQYKEDMQAFVNEMQKPK